MDNELQVIENSYYIGDGEGFDKHSLRAYKCERELKKVVKEKEIYLSGYLKARYNIPHITMVKVSEVKEPVLYDTFSLAELIESKLVGLNSSLTIAIYDIYKEKGIEEAMDNLHKLSNLEII
jgi:hypothetical protein